MAISPSIAIIVTFYGKTPFWMPAFLLSCRENRDVQWLLYTDLDVPDHPPNVVVKNVPLDILNQRCSDALGTRVEISIARRKLCDLKPAYGVIFEEDLRPFDFWAFSDLDIVWGSVRRFATSDLLRDHDIVSARRDKLAGHFTLFRNTPSINRSFELIPDVRTLMTSSHHVNVDEHEFSRVLKEKRVPRIYWREEWTTNAGYQRALGDSAADSLWWRQGRTFGGDGKEFMYVHFHKLKQSMQRINFQCCDSPAAFQINRQGFIA